MIKHYTRVSLCVACAALTLQLSAEVKWTYSGTALTEILPEGSDGTAWAFTLSSTGVLKGKTAGSGAVLDLRNETLPANAPRIVGTIPALVYKGSKTCTEVHLPEGVTAFAVNAFSGWSALTTIVVPSGVKTISSGCFNGCTSLTSVTLPEGIETIGDSAFYGCTAIVNIQLPSTLRTVGTGAFRGCSSLERIEPFFPDGVTSFGDSCLRECPKLEGELRIGYATNDGVMVSTTLAGNGYYLRGSTKVRTMRIGPGVSSLPTYTFDVQSNLAMIELGQNISRTGVAFPRDGGLTNLIVRHAGDFILDGQTFNGMTGLREITWGGWFTRKFVRNCLQVSKLDRDISPILYNSQQLHSHSRED